MSKFAWRETLGRTSGRKRTRVRPKVASSIRCEALEERLLLANDFWTGAASQNWSNPANWSAGAPNPTDTLIFSNVSLAPGGFTATINDIGTNQYDIVFSDSGYTLQGLPIAIVGATAVQSLQPSGTDTIQLDLQLAGDSTITVASPQGNLDVTGQLTSA